MQYNHTERLSKVTTHKVAFTTAQDFGVTEDGGGNDGLNVERNHVHFQIHLVHKIIAFGHRSYSTIKCLINSNFQKNLSINLEPLTYPEENLILRNYSEQLIYNKNAKNGYKRIATGVKTRKYFCTPFYTIRKIILLDPDLEGCIVYLVSIILVYNLKEFDALGKIYSLFQTEQSTICRKLKLMNIDNENLKYFVFSISILNFYPCTQQIIFHVWHNRKT